ncbi:MAG: carboxypeptidase-like regulatory domain-containing protein [Mangrovibacterium sp.]|jgi:ribosomal protein S15P/S13E
MKGLIHYIFTIILLMIMQPVLAQIDDDLIDPVLIQLKGTLVNKEDGSPVPYASVVNMRTHGGTTTDSNGKFTLETLNVDSLSISAMGYMKQYVRIPPKQHQDSLLVIQMRPIRYAIGEVKVIGEANKINMDGVGTGKPVNISPELRGDSYNKKPSWLAALFNPASFLQYHLSRSEKEKRNVREAIITEQQWEYLSQYYNKDMVMTLTGLNEEEADSFMVYFNSKSVLAPNSTEYDVRAAILREFENYKKEKGME